MPRPKKKRVPTCPITFSDYDNLWHGYLNVGRKGNNKLDIRHRSGKTEAECADKILALEDEIEAMKGKAPEAGLKPKMAEYLRGWHAEGVSNGRWKYKTEIDYGLVIEHYLIPHVSDHRVDDFSRSNVHTKHMLAEVERLVSRHAAAKAFRVLRSAMSDAVRDELVDRNIVKTVREPVPSEPVDEEFFTLRESRAILNAIMNRKRLRSRWLTAVCLGQRQGECLALMWQRPEARQNVGDINLDKGTIAIREKLVRKAYRHGCDDPHACGYLPRKGRPNGAHRKPVAKCPGSGPHHDRYHLRGHGCPKPSPGCSPSCKGHAKGCQQVQGGGLHREAPKSRAGVRVMKMPRPLWDAFIERKAEQDRERELAGSVWEEHGYVHTTELGRPIDPRADHEEWQEILREAGVDPAKLHWARHMAATFLLLLKVPMRIVMKIMGWSTDQSKRYQHILEEMMAEVADQLETLLWPVEPKPKKGKKKGKKKAAKGTEAAGSSTDHSTDNVIYMRKKAA